MYMGHIVELASSDELYGDPEHPYTKALLSAIPIPNPELSAAKKCFLWKARWEAPSTAEPGCRFASRCKYASEKCKSKTPKLKEIKKGHFVACHLFDK